MKGSGNEVEFAVNSQIERCDWWVVLHASGLTDAEEVICDPNHLIFVSMEPTGTQYTGKFLKQFSSVIAADKNLQHSNVINFNLISWWVGIRVKFGAKGHEFKRDFCYDYDSFVKMGMPLNKKNRISVITSKKNFLPGHASRLKFIEGLRNHPISQNIDFFGGWGDKEIEDKLDGLLSYKYHLVLENSLSNDYWTEKLGDSFLAWTFPIYSGCPNLNQYFPLGSYISIDISDFKGSVEKLQAILNSNCFDASIPVLAQARDLVLNKYNIFNIIQEICDKPANELKKVRLLPVREFKGSIFERVGSKLKALRSLKRPGFCGGSNL